jgi:hypothetical protein
LNEGLESSEDAVLCRDLSVKAEGWVFEARQGLTPKVAWEKE